MTRHLVSFLIDLDTDAIQAAHTLAEWVDFLNVQHDAFAFTPITPTWEDIYRAIAADYLSGGDYDRYVMHEADDVTEAPA